MGERWNIPRAKICAILENEDGTKFEPFSLALKNKIC